MAEKNEWDDEKTQQFNLRVAPSLLSLIDNWRRHQDDIPGRSEAARRLIEIGLRAERARPRK
jgi:hypothetical protein